MLSQKGETLIMFYLSLSLLHDLQVPHVSNLILSILLTLNLTNLKLTSKSKQEINSLLVTC